jgi:mRNA-degrading endonuclease RelE of RelBE toxin-antitoxin system
MSYTVLITATAAKMLKKLPTQIKTTIFEQSQILKEQPLLGEQLTGELRYFHSFHLKINNVHYRLVYEINANAKTVIVRAVGTRENFYKRLKEMRLRPNT